MVRHLGSVIASSPTRGTSADPPGNDDRVSSIIAVIDTATEFDSLKFRQ